MPNARILVVDDYPGARYRRMRILLDGGFDVAEESMGRDAVRRAAEERIDLVLVDLHLPDVSGIDVCRAIKKNPKSAHLPVLLISAISEREEAARLARSAGAEDFLPDTIEPATLLERVQRTLESQKRA